MSKTSKLIEPRISDATLMESWMRLESFSAVAREIGSDRRGVSRRLHRLLGKKSEAKERNPVIPCPAIPADQQPIADLVSERIRKIRIKKAHEEYCRLLHLPVSDDKPIGIVHLGDPHVDDDGTDIELLDEHLRIIRDTDGLYAANIGDSRNNWVGRLAHLWSEQSTNAEEALALVQWLFDYVKGKWIYIISGNHDCWSGHDSPLPWMAKQIDALHRSSEVRLSLDFPNGKHCIINARHDFSGHSMWNAAHGVGKAAQMGARDNVVICGHKHTSGYMMVKCPATGTISHCLQIASYKVFDRYAKERGFRDQHISPAVMTIINPQATDELGFVQVFHDVAFGADVLKHMRNA